jgi:hypothetical protein
LASPTLSPLVKGILKYAAKNFQYSKYALWCS